MRPFRHAPLFSSLLAALLATSCATGDDPSGVSLAPLLEDEGHDEQLDDHGAAYEEELGGLSYDAPALAQTLTCLWEDAECEHPELADFVRRHGADPHEHEDGSDCGSATMSVVEDLAQREGIFEELWPMIEPEMLPAPPVDPWAEDEEQHPVRFCGLHGFMSPMGRFDIRYAAHCDDPDTDREITTLDGRAVRLRAGGGVFGGRNAPDHIEMLGHLLDSAHRLVTSRGFARARTGSDVYTVFVTPVVRSYVLRSNSHMYLDPQHTRFSTGDMNSPKAHVAVHEFMHQLQWDYGWNGTQGAFVDTAMVESLASAMARHQYERFPLRNSLEHIPDFPHSRFWQLPYFIHAYSYVMQILSSDRPGVRCFGCDGGERIFRNAFTNGWRLRPLFDLLAAQNPGFTPARVARESYLHEVYGYFARGPSFLADPSFRYIDLEDPGRTDPRGDPGRHAPPIIEGECGTHVTHDWVVARGRSFTCQTRQSWSLGEPKLYFFPIDSDLPEVIDVRVRISYDMGGGLLPVTSAGPRTMRGTLRAHTASGGRDDYRPANHANNEILATDTRTLEPGTRFFRFDFRNTGLAKKPRSIAFVLDWESLTPAVDPMLAYDVSFEVQGQTIDTDGDGMSDLVDACPLVAGSCANDPDGDNVPNAQDNCPNHYNWQQLDTDRDGVGDVCDPDSKPDVHVRLGGMNSIGASFVIENIGSYAVTRDFSYRVSGWQTNHGYTTYFGVELPLRLTGNGIPPGGTWGVNIPTWLIDPALVHTYTGVTIHLDSKAEIDELDEANNYHRF